MSHPGTYMNAPTLGVTGLVPADPDTAVTFDPASDQYVVQDDTIAAQVFTALTLGAIIKPNDPTDANQPTFWGVAGASDSIGFFTTTAGKVDFNGVSNSTVDAFSILSTTVMSPGSTYRVIGTWDGTTAKLYIDGVLEGSQGPISDIDLVDPESFHAATDQFNTTGNVSFDGTLDELFFIADHALTAPEVATIDDAMTGTGDIETEINALSPYIYWRLGEASGTAAADSAAVAPITEGPAVRLVTTRALAVPHQVQRWVLPIICKEFVKIGDQDNSEAPQDVAAVRDFFLGLRRSGTPVAFQEGASRHLVVVRDVSFPDGMVEQWGNQRAGLEGILVVTLDSTEA